MVGFSCTIMVSSPPGVFPGQRDFSLLTATGDVGGPSHCLQRRTTGRWSCRPCLWLSLLLGGLYRSGCFSRRTYQSFPNGRWAVSLDLRAGTSKVSQLHFLDHWSVFTYASPRSILKCRLNDPLSGWQVMCAWQADLAAIFY